MKAVLTLALMTIASTSAFADTRITGTAAQELYAALNLPEVGAHDEHGGPDYGTAKYGQDVGCIKFLDGSAECWVNN